MQYNVLNEGDLDLVFITNQELFNQMTAGRIWIAGNLYGIGDGASVARYSPVQPLGEATWNQISSGENFSAAIKTDGTLWLWGYDQQSQQGAGTTNIITWSPHTTIGGGTNWKQVAAGYNHCCAIKTDGTLWGWGWNVHGQLGDGTAADKSSPITTAGGGNNWKQVSSAWSHTAAIKTDGTLWTWGSSSTGALGAGSTLSRSSPGTVAGGGTNWKQVSVSSSTGISAAIKTDGTLWSWGYNANGELGNGTTTNTSSPSTTAGGGTDWKFVSAGRNCCAIKNDGTLWSWGYNGYGAVGDGTNINRSSPTTVAKGGMDWKTVTCGEYSTAAIKTDGTLWVWGHNGYGQLGLNAVPEHINAPTQWPYPMKFKACSHKVQNIMALEQG